MLTNLWLSLGLTRDSAIWFWARVVAVATLVLAGIKSGQLDVVGLGAWLGVTLPAVAAHWIQAVCVITLWIAGVNATSNLPGSSRK